MLIMSFIDNLHCEFACIIAWKNCPYQYLKSLNPASSRLNERTLLPNSSTPIHLANHFQTNSHQTPPQKSHQFIMQFQLNTICPMATIFPSSLLCKSALHCWVPTRKWFPFLCGQITKLAIYNVKKLTKRNEANRSMARVCRPNSFD